MHPRVFGAKALRNHGVEHSGRSCASIGDDTAEAVGIGLHGHREGANGDTCSQEIPAPEAETLLGQSFLGQRILRGYGRAR